MGKNVHSTVASEEYKIYILGFLTAEVPILKNMEFWPVLIYVPWKSKLNLGQSKGA